MTASEQLKRLLGSGALPSLKTLLAQLPEGSNLTVSGLTVNFDRQRWNDAVLTILYDMVDKCDLLTERNRMFDGQPINSTEQRAVLHTALRASRATLEDWVNGQTEQDIDRASVAELITEGRTRMADLVNAIHRGEHRGYTGKRFTDVVNIGIGGSHLGPELVVDALARPADRSHQPFLRAHFISNIDGHRLDQTLTSLNPETTLFVVVSKSFSTLETALNADAIRSWFLERTGSVAAIAQHFIAVSNNVAAAAAFGLPAERVLAMGDWVGGRYSLWSTVGISIALALGWNNFRALLRGAEAMDRHFLEAEREHNLPLAMALSEWLNVSVYGCTSHAVLCYDDRLRLLPDYLQQLEMESNGKRVNRAGRPLETPTQPVLWGGVGTNGQHAFHQLLHQGTATYFADFILCRHAQHRQPDMQRWLQANAVAQGQGMAAGQTHDNPHRVVPGNHPSTTLILDSLQPETLGALLAAYEHKVFCLGILWDINSFDQWGVELGKVLARPLAALLQARTTAPAPDDLGLAAQDAATRALLDALKDRGAT